MNLIKNYFEKKSVKISDSYVFYIQKTEKEPYIEYVECIGVDLPKLAYTEEVIQYGNTSQLFLTPQYDSLKEVSFDFYETHRFKIRKLLESFFSYNLEQHISSDGYSTNSGTYDINKYIHSIKIKIPNNKLHKFVYEYVFHNLKLSKYDIYELNYDDDNPSKYKLYFTFESYEKRKLNEVIGYKNH